nr:MAG TPA: tail completion protein [Caudoviricetes sp.]
MNLMYSAMRGLIMQFTDAKSVIQMAQNKVSKPAREDFISMFFVHQQRTSTNIHDWNGETHEMTMTQPTQVRCQIDCYGEKSHEWATRLSTILRDMAGCDFLEPYQIQPMYASDPVNLPLESDGRNQFSQRWTLEAFLAVPQSFVIRPDYFENVDVTMTEATTV